MPIQHRMLTEDVGPAVRLVLLLGLGMAGVTVL